MRVSEIRALEKPSTLPTIIGFDIPAISSWTAEAHRPVVARLSKVPPVEWQQAFEAELVRSDAIIKTAKLQLSADRINFLALPTNIGSLRYELRRLVAQINHRAIKAIRKSQRSRQAESIAPADRKGQGHPGTQRCMTD